MLVAARLSLILQGWVGGGDPGGGAGGRGGGRNRTTGSVASRGLCGLDGFSRLFVGMGFILPVFFVRSLGFLGAGVTRAYHATIPSRQII
jgi:hypothetical protein